jgi:hypothetical protein
VVPTVAKATQSSARDARVVMATVASMCHCGRGATLDDRNKEIKWRISAYVGASRNNSHGHQRHSLAVQISFFFRCVGSYHCMRMLEAPSAEYGADEDKGTLTLLVSASF